MPQVIRLATVLMWSHCLAQLAEVIPVRVHMDNHTVHMAIQTDWIQQLLVRLLAEMTIHNHMQRQSKAIHKATHTAIQLHHQPFKCKPMKLKVCIHLKFKFNINQLQAVVSFHQVMHSAIHRVHHMHRVMAVTTPLAAKALLQQAAMTVTMVLTVTEHLHRVIIIFLHQN